MLEVELRGRAGAHALDVSFRAGPGALVIAGPNGAGKSTLLRMLCGAVRPESGRVVLEGRVLFTRDAAGAASGVDLPPEARRLGYLPQDYALFPHLNARKNVEFALFRDPDRARRAQALLDSFDLGRVAGRRPATLSGGERQRTALARALAGDPQALILDEPLAALDAGARRQVRALLCSQLAALPLPAILVTHDPEDAAAFASRILILEEGRVVQDGTFAELRAHPRTAFVAEFVAGRAP